MKQMNENLDFNEIKDTVVDKDHQLFWERSIIPLIENERALPFPLFEIKNYVIIDNNTIRLCVTPQAHEWVFGDINLELHLHSCTRSSHSWRPVSIYYFDLKFIDNDNLHSVMFMDHHFLFYIEHNDSYRIRLHSINGVKTLVTPKGAKNGTFTITKAFCINLKKMLGDNKIDEFLDFASCTITHDRKEIMDLFYDCFKFVICSNSLLFERTGWNKLGYVLNNFGYIKKEVDENFDFNNVCDRAAGGAVKSFTE